MTAKKITKRILLFSVTTILILIIYYAWSAFPIISGYGSKYLCSAVFIDNREPEDVINIDLADFPLSLGHFAVDYKDSSVTGTVWGFAKKKAIFRKGLGCTIINDIEESALRAQKFAIASPPSINTDTIPWPMGDRVADSFPAQIDEQKLSAAVDQFFMETDTLHKMYSRAVLVLYDGKIVAEKYAPGYDKHSPMLGWSMSKSITCTLIGLLVKDGKLKTDQPAPVPEWAKADDPRHAITLDDILHQSSGLDFEEVYSKSSEATQMLFEKGDMAAFTAGRPLKYAPGSVFSYSSGNSNILSRIIRQTVGDESYFRFPYDSLFYKMGMYHTLLEVDASGTIVGSSYAHASCRDWARFGLLYYNKGLYNGTQILPESWVEKVQIPAPASRMKEYGSQFWLNGIDTLHAGKRILADIPADMYRAAGYGGQDVFIIPSKKMVVVRLGLHEFDVNTLLAGILKSVK